MPATQTPCTPDADRFLRSVAVPDPPAGAFARQRYWDDTVQEAVGELRRRLASSREAVVTLALLTIVKMETARMRHGRPVSGTQVSNVREEWDDLPKLAPLDEVFVYAPLKPDVPAGDEKKVPPVEPNAPTVAEPTTSRDREGAGSSGEGEAPAEPLILVAPASEPVCMPFTGSEAGATKPEPAPSRSRLVEETRTFSDRDDDWTRDPARSATPSDWQPGPTRAEADAAYDRVVEQQREGFIETSGLYPEDEYPNNPDYFRFKAEPRPHPAFLRFLEWKYGITTRPPGGTDIPVCASSTAQTGMSVPPNQEPHSESADHPVKPLG